MTRREVDATETAPRKGGSMKQKILEHYIASAIAKARLKPHRKVSDALADAMPEVVAELRRLATAPDSDVSTRKFAIGMLESFWRTLLNTACVTAVKREHARTRAKRVATAATQAARVHARNEKVLTEFEKALGGKDGTQQSGVASDSQQPGQF